MHFPKQVGGTGDGKTINAHAHFMAAWESAMRRREREMKNNFEQYVDGELTVEELIERARDARTESVLIRELCDGDRCNMRARGAVTVEQVEAYQKAVESGDLSGLHTVLCMVSRLEVASRHA